MFTSLQPITHQTTEGMKDLPHDVATLAEQVRHAGVDTGAITEDAWVSVNFGFGRGFDVFRETKDSSEMGSTGQVDVTFASARKWLHRNRDKHFFLFLHTYQVHSPYTPPARYAVCSPSTTGSGSTSARRRICARWPTTTARSATPTTSFADSSRAVEALGLAENTVFIVTSDHGEAFLEHAPARARGVSHRRGDPSCR